MTPVMTKVVHPRTRKMVILKIEINKMVMTGIVYRKKIMGRSNVVIQTYDLSKIKCISKDS